MDITQLLSPSDIILDNSPDNKQILFSLLARKMAENHYIAPQDEATFIDALNAREALSTTAIGDGIAIPHAKSALVNAPRLLMLRSRQSIVWDIDDDEPVHLVFMIAVPASGSDEHLEILTQLCRWLMDDEFRERLLNAEHSAEIVALLQAKQQQSGQDNSSDTQSTKDLIVAVTACPTGIAHTYMAAENLEKAGKALGYEIKVETNGSVGVENALTAEDIRRSKAVVIAADTKVDMGRFVGKPLHYTSVAKGIKEPEALIAKALESAPYHSGKASSSPTQGEASATAKGPGVYSCLMNGVSNMLPFVVAGGILIAISFFWGINSANPQDPSYNYIAHVIQQIGGAAFTLFIPVMAGYIAYAIADRPGLAPGMVGGLLANTGGSGFLGAIMAGFIAGYAILLLKKLLKPLPKSLDGIKPVLLLPLISVFIVGVITVAVMNPIMSEVNTAITHFLNNIGATNKIFLGFVIGAMLAADLGGPINKAAYLFSVGVLASGNYFVMAAAVASGMVPSLAVAVAATLSRQKFTRSQREAAKANYILGLSFIAEGAIPFAASNPLVILPSLMIGSGIAGSVAMIFDVTYPAPHGGVFVLPVVGHPILFILSTAIGVAVSTALILIFKKKLSAEELAN
ncbi:fructose-specific PTS transporter subunit EIIC [Buttiauxella gaviniae]|uniref:PTS fructose transporter subunit IIABC n=1 Tax=Buttiauxella gaviniae TaxID=82990 RepID=UPI0039AF98BC